jgi:hypothetical protein
MSTPVTKENLPGPVPSKAETKSEITTRTVRAMLDAEVESREAKTAKLRKARLAMEAAQPAPAPGKTRRKAAPKARSGSAL